jgi:hypothetical protein
VILTTTDKLLLSGLLPKTAGGLRALLDDPHAAIDWEAVIRCAELHGIAALLRFNLAGAGLLEALPLHPRQALYIQAQLQAARHLALASEARRLIRALNAAGVTALPLKGAALMLGGYYPQAGLRAAADIDLLVSPERLIEAERIAHACGYLVKKYPDAEPGTTLLPPRAEHRLPAELNHAEARSGPGGLILELHRRAFHYARGARDFGFAEMIARAVPQPDEKGGSLLLPAPEDLCLHLVHHTLVDLRSTHLILRTVADLHFIEQYAPGVLERLKEQAAAMGLAAAALAAIDLLRAIQTGTLAEAGREGRMAALLEAALQQSPAALAAAATVFEHFDVQLSLAGAVRSLAAVAFTSREHLARDYGTQAAGPVFLHYPRRLFDVMRKFNWKSLHPATLRRLIRLRRIGRPQSAGK